MHKKRIINRDFKSRKSYFAVPTEIFDAYRLRKISATDVKIFAYLCSLRLKNSGVQVSQRRIAEVCGVTEKTVAASVERLYNADFITAVVTMRKERHFRFETSVYGLKPITKGFFLFSRSIFFRAADLPPQALVVLAFFCHATSFEFEKSWNSYSDICHRLGYNQKNSRSRVMKTVKILTEQGFVGKRCRKAVKGVKNVFTDNIYRVSGYVAEILKKEWIPRAAWIKMKLQKQIEKQIEQYEQWAKLRLLLRKTKLPRQQNGGNGVALRRTTVSRQTQQQSGFSTIQPPLPLIAFTYSDDFPF